MATPKTVRIVANTNLKGLRTVNVASVAPSSAKPHMQVSVGKPGSIGTVQDSGGTIKGLPTIFVSGYSGPA